jgi:uncharacterized protein YutE (UPF0331/DUF86 family)
MTDAALLARKLAHLRHQIERARHKRPDDVDAFASDEDTQALVAMATFVAIQEAADLAFHIVGSKGWGVPASYADAFKILSSHGVIDHALSQQMTSTVKVRNLIAHGYASLDPERLWADLPDGLEALERYSVAIARFASAVP